MGGGRGKGRQHQPPVRTTKLQDTTGLSGSVHGAPASKLGNEPSRNGNNTWCFPQAQTRIRHVDPEAELIPVHVLVLILTQAQVPVAIPTLVPATIQARVLFAIPIAITNPIMTPILMPNKTPGTGAGRAVNTRKFGIKTATALPTASQTACPGVNPTRIPSPATDVNANPISRRGKCTRAREQARGGRGSKATGVADPD